MGLIIISMIAQVAIVYWLFRLIHAAFRVKSNGKSSKELEEWNRYEVIYNSSIENDIRKKLYNEDMAYRFKKINGVYMLDYKMAELNLVPVDRDIHGYKPKEISTVIYVNDIIRNSYEVPRLFKYLRFGETVCYAWENSMYDRSLRYKIKSGIEPNLNRILYE